MNDPPVPPPPPPPPRPAPIPMSATFSRSEHDRSGAWAGAWILVYSMIATAWWGVTLFSFAFVSALPEMARRFAEVQADDPEAVEAFHALAEVCRSAPEGLGSGAAPLAGLGALLAVVLGAAAVGVLLRNGTCRRAAAGLVAASALFVVAWTVYGIAVIHPARTAWTAEVRQALVDLRTAGGNVDQDLIAMLSGQSAAAVAFEVCMQTFHLAVLGLLLWAAMRRGTRRWCDGGDAGGIGGAAGRIARGY